MAVNIEQDDLVFFPLLYWPVRAEAAVPSDAALAKIDTYMKNGGTIFFDLREDGAGFDSLSGGVSPSAAALRRILAKLDIPPIDYQDAYYYAAPKAKPKLGSLDEVDPEILRVYEKLGIHSEGRKVLAGAAGVGTSAADRV